MGKSKTHARNQVKKKTRLAKDKNKRKAQNSSSSEDEEEPFKTCSHCSEINVSKINVHKDSSCSFCKEPSAESEELFVDCHSGVIACIKHIKENFENSEYQKKKTVFYSSPIQISLKSFDSYCNVCKCAIGFCGEMSSESKHTDEVLLKKSISIVKKAINKEEISTTPSKPSPALRGKNKKKGKNGTSYRDLMHVIPSDPPFDDGILSTIKGCDNLGNTCFFNSVMQSMAQTDPLVSYFLGVTNIEKFKRYEGPLSTCLAIFIAEMFSKEVSTVHPNYLFSQIAKTNGKFRGYEQQDSQELLRCLQYEVLLEYEKSERNVIYDSFKFLLQSNILCHSCKSISKKSEDCFDISIPIPHANSDKPDDLESLEKAFEKLKLKELEIFEMNSNEILNPSKISDAVSHQKKGKHTSLLECLWLFMRNELLTGDNAYLCEKCNVKKDIVEKKTVEVKREVEPWIRVTFQPRDDEDGEENPIEVGLIPTVRPVEVSEDNSDNINVDMSPMTPMGFGDKIYCNASKQFSFLELPPVLTIHLKRFKHKKNGFIKDSTRISYPFDLDLEAFMNPNSKPQNTKYRLYAIVDHSGSLNSGHYVAYTRKLIIHQDGKRQRGDWYYISDSKVRKVDETEVSNADAYILFYERVENE